MRTHEDLDAWKKAINLVTNIYEVTEDCPRKEIYGLTNQIRRLTASVPSNIAKSGARGSNKDFLWFLYIAMGSSAQLETQLIISKNLAYIGKRSFRI